jgi:hypothetical protein
MYEYSSCRLYAFAENNNELWEVWRRAKWAYLFCSKEVWGVTPPHTHIKFCKRADLSNRHVIFSREKGGGGRGKKPHYPLTDWSSIKGTWTPDGLGLFLTYMDK